VPINRKFRKKVRDALGNRPLRVALGNFADSYPSARENAYKGIDFEALRDRIEKVKAGSVEKIETLARQFEEKVIDRGGKVYRAADGQVVADIIAQIARRRNAKLCVKSKSMATEEIRLNDRLKDVMRVVETDLGEWIVQQIDERPSHMVMPAIHLTRQRCAEIFSNVLGENVEPDIPRMVKLARKILRAEFLKADIGITGCNVAVAETGTMVIFTNEGNGRLTTSLPPVHIVVMGYEKLVPKFKDIAPLAAAIPRSATCQYLTSYVTMITGPTETFNGPGDGTVVEKELHVILLDNGRLELLRDPIFKKIGQCVRCASCLNVCPVYTMVGGQVYGDVYAGGIGALLTAFLSSPEDAEKIQELCLNCGKCREFCPGKIDIPALVLELRSKIREKIPPPILQKVVIDNLLPHKKLLDISVKAAVPGSRVSSRVPDLAAKSFKNVFKNLKQEINEQRGTVGFFYGCMIDYVYPEIGESMVKLLNRAGLRVDVPKQGCCGAPAIYSGLEKSAGKMVKDNAVPFNANAGNYDHIITPCPTCTHVLSSRWTGRAAEKTIDFIKLIHMLWKDGYFRITGEGEPVDVTYHYSCHLKRSSGIDREPREVLSSLPGVRWIEMAEADRCCGFAGTYSIKLPEISNELLDRKIENIKKSGTQVVLTDCPGCLMSLRNGLKRANVNIQVLHTAVFLSKYAFGDHEPFLRKKVHGPPKTSV
jgi:iron-sulfur cluster protein